MHTIWSPTSNLKITSHMIYCNLSGWIRDLTTPNHCLKNSRVFFQETKNQRSSSRTQNSAATLHFKNQEPCWIPSLQEISWLLDDIPHTIQDHQYLINSSLPSENDFQENTQGYRNFQTPLSLKNFLMNFLSFLLLKKRLHIDLRTFFIIYPLQLGQIPP